MLKPPKDPKAGEPRLPPLLFLHQRVEPIVPSLEMIQKVERSFSSDGYVMECGEDDTVAVPSTENQSSSLLSTAQRKETRSQEKLFIDGSKEIAKAALRALQDGRVTKVQDYKIDPTQVRCSKINLAISFLCLLFYSIF
jgi:hypothetical protein